MTAMAAAAPHPYRDPLLPRAPGGLAGGAAMAVAVHIGLALALAAVVNWRTQAPDVVASAELWAAVPQVAAPPAAAPAPTPVQAAVPTPAPAPPPVLKAIERTADIAVEREKDRRAAELATKTKTKADAKSKAEAEAKAEAAAQDTQLVAQRAENLRRMMGQAGGAASAPPTSTGTAMRDAAPSASYTAKLVAAIRANLVYTGSPAGNPTAEVEVRAGPSGTILSRRLIKGSGVGEWDDAVLRAIDRTTALPRDTDGRVPPVLIVAFKFRE